MIKNVRAVWAMGLAVVVGAGALTGCTKCNKDGGVVEVQQGTTKFKEGSKTIGSLIPLLYDKMPENIRKANTAEKLLATVSAENEQNGTWDAEWTNDECMDVVTLRVVGRKDGKALVLMMHNGGCNCTQMREVYAGIFDGTKLEETAWPLERTTYEEVVSNVCEWNVSAEEKEFTKKSWQEGNYFWFNDDEENNTVVGGVGEVLCEGGDPVFRSRVVNYTFDGETFKKAGYGEYQLLNEDEKCFGPVVLGQKLPEISIEGCMVDQEVAYTYVKDRKTGVILFGFFAPMSTGTVSRIEVCSKDYAKEVGELVNDVLKTWVNDSVKCYKPDEYTCYITRGYGRILEVDPKEVEGKGEGEKGLVSEFKISPQAKVRTVVLTDDYE